MANYRKSFNLRNGVQVDDDNFIVNSNGLVGIGTSVPTEFLDVRGNAKVVGLVTANTLYAGIATIGVLNVTQGVSVTGVVTATTFSGSASGLTNIYAIAVDGWYIDSGNSYISTTFNVGIGTTLPQGNLQIGTAVTFSLNGNTTYSGIVTALSFSGSGVGLTALSAPELTGTINNARLPSNINVSGIITATSGFVGNVTGTASTALSLNGTPNISVANITANNYNSSGILTAVTINSGFSTSGIATIYNTLNIAALGTLGIGTNNPNADIHIRDANDGASIQLTSDGSNEAYVAIGRSVTRTQNNGELRFGNTSASQKYSTQSSLDIINYGLGNVNNYLNLGSSGIGTGAFNWIYGQTANSPLMTLTHGGSLGIGVTIPTNTLHVVGTSTVTGNSYVSGNFFVSGSVDIGSNLTANNFNANTLTGSLVGSLTGNVNATTGISTFNQIRVNSAVGFTTVTISSNVGIQTFPSATYALIVNAGSGAFIVDSLGGIGVGTNVFTYAPALAYSVSVDAARGVGYFQGVGVGTITPRSFADFSAAGYNVPGLGSIYQFMIPPKVSTSQRNSLSAVEGGLIYNTSNRRLEVYIGSGWCGIATIP
jgi:cytoskeletal protein CcmA (bactofilin family)